MSQSAGERFRLALKEESPLQIIGTINAYCAILAESIGFRALYVSGAGVANASYGLPDLAITSLNDVLIDVKRITDSTDVPLLVDIDTGWGSAFNIARAAKQMQLAGAAAIHIEDQSTAKRCGHRPNKTLVSCEEMVDRIKSAVDSRTDENFVIVARTDAFTSEGMAAIIERSQRYIEAGADMIFPEAMTTLNQYQQFAQVIDVPVLANITEFGKTPLFTLAELKRAGVGCALYPLSAFRAMSATALHVYQQIRETGSQAKLLSDMQTREALYQLLDYHRYEEKLDELFFKERNDDDK